MFVIQSETDAWEVGVLKAAGYIDGETAEELEVPAHLVEFFEAGVREHCNLSGERVDLIAMSHGYPAPDRELREKNSAE